MTTMHKPVAGQKPQLSVKVVNNQSPLFRPFQRAQPVTDSRVMGHLSSQRQEQENISQQKFFLPREHSLQVEPEACRKRDYLSESTQTENNGIRQPSASQVKSNLPNAKMENKIHNNVLERLKEVSEKSYGSVINATYVSSGLVNSSPLFTQSLLRRSLAKSLTMS